MKTLDELVMQDLPEAEALGRLDVDVSAFFGQKPETTFFRFREPDIAQVFQVPVDAELLLKHADEYPENLRMTIALLAQAHQEPPSPSVPTALLYVQIAKKNRKLFTHLSSAFNTAFPHLMGSKEALDEEKKSSGSTEETNSTSA